MLHVEVADNPIIQSKGLMFRKELKDDSGMLFVFGHSQELRFWGENTFIPLDIAFVSPEKQIVKIAHIKPLSKKVITSDQDCIIAIEANAGYFAKNNIKVGDFIEIEDDVKAGYKLGKIVSFRKKEG